MPEIIVRPIGRLCTPYQDPAGVPIQGRFDPDVRGRALVAAWYRPGLRDIEGFSHLILVYRFHRISRTALVVQPFLEDVPHGVFATRTPTRPNRLGLSIVRLLRVFSDGFEFAGVDMLDQTPLLDIKPYISHFDDQAGVKNGWAQKHFRNGRIPKRVRIQKPL